jgi:hypothetical protein
VTVNVSAGAAAGGGVSPNNGAAGTASTATAAVVLDADGGLGAQPNSPAAGRVVNNGSILAMGSGLLGAGGDVWFDGRNSAGANLGAGDGGSQIRTGTVATGDFVPN